MLKNKIWLGIILSVILLVFSTNGFTAYYKYTQESGANFYVGIGDKADALEDTNEARQILDDLGNLLVHSKRNDLYPKDGTIGGTLAIPNSALVSFATGTKGDLFYCSVANVWIKLNIGADNKILVVATDLPNWETATSDLLSDVASIAMLDENEAITGAWTVTGSIGGVDTTEFGYLANITAFGASIIDDADEATFKATVNLEIGTDVLAYQAIGIANDNIVEMDDADAAIDDYCKLTANGIVGRSYSEVKTDLGIDLSLYYLKTEMDSFSEIQAIISDKTLVNVEDGITATAIQDNLILKADFADEDWGDMTVSTNVVTIDSGAVTYAKIQNISTTDKILGRATAGAGVVEEIVCTSAGRALIDDADASTQRTTLSIDLSLYYLKTEIDTQGEMEAIWSVTLATDTELAALKFTDLDDTPASYDNGKYAKSTVDGVVWDTPPGGYTNLTSFVDQTAWRVFYSNTDGDVVEIALGTDGQYLKSTGAASAPIFDTPAGAGDMLKATYDADEDAEIDVAGGGTEKDSWTQYCIPYLSDTIVFGEIPIGTAEYALTVAAGATGYDWTLFDLSLYYLKTEIDTQGEMETIWGDTVMNDLEDDTDPDLGGQLQAGAHSINFTEQILSSGTAIAWNLGNSNKAILTAAHNFTITITAPSGALNAQVIITQDGTGTRVMDEIITQADTTIATTDVHADTEIIDITIDIPTGARIRFDNDVGTDVPEPLVEDTIYYAINEDSTHIKVATTKANAIAGTEIDITDQGTNVHTVEQLVKWPDGTLGVLSTDAGWEDIVSLTYKTADKQWYAQVGLNFQ